MMQANLRLPGKLKASTRVGFSDLLGCAPPAVFLVRRENIAYTNGTLSRASPLRASLTAPSWLEPQRLARSADFTFNLTIWQTYVYNFKLIAGVSA
jgi:hypothetical protein